jgi:hypothetical protein
MKSTTPPTVPGNRYGRLLVLSEAETRCDPGGKRYRCWRCRCDCGQEAVVRQQCLRNGATRSCGCLLRESQAVNMRKRPFIHGKWKTPEFRIWGAMLERCQRPNHRYFHRYGGRGITVCDRWRYSFQAFLDDMGERPSPQHSLNRIDNDGNYEPGNVRWALSTEQNRNRSDNHFVTFQGETLCLTDWARRVGIGKATLRRRIMAGWSVERALTEPVG